MGCALMIRIDKKDVLADSHSPISHFFDIIHDSDFVGVMKYLSQGIGCFYEVAACFFPSDLDEYEIAKKGLFEGVKFEFFGFRDVEDIIVDHQTFYYYLQKACKSHMKYYPDDIEKLVDILQKTKERFNL